MKERRRIITTRLLVLMMGVIFFTALVTFWKTHADVDRRNTRGIDHIGVTVPDIEAATRFLVEAFDAEILHDTRLRAGGPRGGPEIEARLGIPMGAQMVCSRMLRLGNGPGVELFEYSADSRQKPAVPSDFGLQHFAVYVDDIEKAADRVVRAGGQVLKGPGDLPGPESGPNNRYWYTRTPWGSTIELVTYPSPQAYIKDTTLRRWTPQSR